MRFRCSRRCCIFAILYTLVCLILFSFFMTLTTYLVVANVDIIRHTYHTVGGVRILPCTDKEQYAQMAVDLIHVCKQLNEVNITYWLDDGTLLGAIRDHGILHHDHDMDVGYMFKDRSRVHVTLGNGMVYGKYMDLYRYEKYNNDTLVRRFKEIGFIEKLQILQGKAQMIPHKWYFPTTSLGGASPLAHCKVPRHAHEILRTKYGSDYMVHVPCR